MIMTKTPRSRWVGMGAMGAAAIGCAIFANARDVRAQGGGPQAEVLVIHGTQCEKPTVDPQIGEMPPLKYNCYKLLERKVLPLTKGQSSTTPLPNGRTFQITYGDLTADKRYKIAASISQPDGKGFL